MADFHWMTSWEPSECRLGEGDGEGEGEQRREEDWGVEPEPGCLPPGCTSASWGGALRQPLTKDERVRVPRDAGRAQPGGSLNHFALRR
jgi:hypothetical protein